jgi:trimeric autotransporter adhesin
MDFGKDRFPIPIQIHNSDSTDQTRIMRRTIFKLALASAAGVALSSAAIAADPTQYIDVNSSATGNQNNDGALGADSIAIGPDAATSSTADGAIALGNGAQANAENAISIGANRVGGSDSFAIGSNNMVGSGNYIFLSGAQNSVAAANSETLVDGNINTVVGTGNSKIQMLGSRNTLQGDNSSMVQMLGVSNVALGGTSNSAMIGNINALGANNKNNSIVGSSNTLGTNNSFVSVLGVSNTTTGGAATISSAARTTMSAPMR